MMLSARLSARSDWRVVWVDPTPWCHQRRVLPVCGWEHAGMFCRFYGIQRVTGDGGLGHNNSKGRMGSS